MHLKILKSNNERNRKHRTLVIKLKPGSQGNNSAKKEGSCKFSDVKLETKINVLIETRLKKKMIKLERMKFLKENRLIETDNHEMLLNVTLASWLIEPIRLLIQTLVGYLNFLRRVHIKKRVRRNEPLCSPCSHESQLSNKCRHPAKFK